MSGLVKFLIAVIICIAPFFIFYTTKEVDREGIVISHNTASSKTGSIYYYTIIKQSDGSLINKKGLSYYVIEPGKKVYWKDNMIVKRKW